MVQATSLPLSYQRRGHSMIAVYMALKRPSIWRLRVFNIAEVTLATAESPGVFKASAFAAEYP
jgi:hypothetical protein